MNRPRYRKDFAAHFNREPGGNERATFKRGFDDDHPQTQPRNDSIALWKMCGERGTPQRKLRQNQALCRKNALR